MFVVARCGSTSPCLVLFCWLPIAVDALLLDTVMSLLLICFHLAPDPKILLLNIELELKSEKENAEIRLDDPAKYQSIVDAEWNIIYDKLAK